MLSRFYVLYGPTLYLPRIYTLESSIPHGDSAHNGHIRLGRSRRTRSGVLDCRKNSGMVYDGLPFPLNGMV